MQPNNNGAVRHKAQAQLDRNEGALVAAFGVWPLAYLFSELELILSWRR